MKCVSTVYIVNHKKDFLMMYNKKQGAWLPPGGFIEGDEMIHECAIRETKEEAGESIAKSLRFMGHVAFPINQLDERSKVSPTPLFVVEQKLSDAKVVENFIYLAEAYNETIEVHDYNARWYNYQELKNIQTYDNVHMQIEYIYKHLEEFLSFPEEEKTSTLQYHK